MLRSGAEGKCSIYGLLHQRINCIALQRSRGSDVEEVEAEKQAISYSEWYHFQPVSGGGWVSQGSDTIIYEDDNERMIALLGAKQKLDTFAQNQLT